MGYLLKEALKTLCGVNQWSYAVFWKIGCQNPKLLIWEECYYGPVSCLGLPGFSGNGNLGIDFQDYNNSSSVAAENLNLRPDVPAGDKVHFLVNKMMTDSNVKVIGEGLVGRVAFTGNYQWILSENYYREPRPPEVLKEALQQFSAGMQTITVIPVLPLGVVQFGSHLTIAENIGFVNDVLSLILQLGHIPGVLQSENHAANKLVRGQLTLESNTSNASSFVADSFKSVGCSAQSSMFDGQTSFALAGEIQNEMQSSITSFQASNSSPCHLKPQESKIARAANLDFSSRNQFINRVAKAEVINPSNSNVWTSQQSSLCTPRYEKDLSSSGLKNLNLSKTETFAQTVSNPFKDKEEHLKISKLMPSFVEDRKQKIEHLMKNTNYDDACMIQPQSGDDLFDVLGAGFKNKLFNSCWNSRSRNESEKISSSEICSSGQGNLDSGISSFAGSDHLLDAVVSKAHLLDDTVSCRTTLTNTSSSSASMASLPYGCFGDFDRGKGELLGIPKYLAKAKEDSRTYSQGSYVYDPWTEKGQNVKWNNSVATGYSNKPNGMSKPNRKRLKPGENPRPRPKDRQMIQDRVKELREIVPNGAKCSIDALLERTIKHMLFLQGVTKHADELKQTAESKIISNDDGLLLKDNSGGATWAYEVGSQSMVCPIIVEDLNQPHQMLVEMLCAERGLFLEIADIIRGLGLTILKGLMENRNDKIWACFTVEANRNVTRMEVFLALVCLLDQNAKTGVPQPDSNNDNKIVKESHQAALVLVTGGSVGIC